MVEIVVFERRVGQFRGKFQGERGVAHGPPMNFGVRKLESLGYHVVALFASSYV